MEVPSNPPYSCKRSLAWTGGIASGKSRALAYLKESVPHLVVYDSDESVRKMLDESESVRAELLQTFGRSVLKNDEVDRTWLRERVFGNPIERAKLEGILHPRVSEECLASRDRWSKTGPASLFVADIPLFFESRFNVGFDHSVVIAASRETQIERLRQRNGFDRELAEQILLAQLPMAEKARMADFVLWNEGPEKVLREQVRRLSEFLLTTMTSDSEQATPAAEPEAVAAVVETPSYDLPESANLGKIRDLPLADIYTLVEALPIRIPANCTKAQLVYELVSFYLKNDVEVTGEGVLEQTKPSFAMLRDESRSFKTSADDLYLAGPLVDQYKLRPGQLVKGRLKTSNGRDKFTAVAEVLEIDGVPVADWESPKDFDSLTAMFPDQRFVLERGKEGPLSVRVVDLMAPLGKGQRGLIVAPPRGGKTILLKQIAKSIQENHPESHLVILLLDERPEEVTDFEETVNVTVYASTFDENHKRHAQVSDLALERAKRLVEQGKDVVLLLDSLTRLARGHNSAQRGGPIGSGGVSPAALQKSRKFFNAARNCEEGGSLTILATALVETENRMDEVIFEEFKGTGNMEIKLDQELAERRVFPAIHIQQSGTRNDDRLYHPDEMAKVLEIRRQLTQLPVGEAITTLLKNLDRTDTNAELLLSGLR